MARENQRNMQREEGQQVDDDYCPTELDEDLDMLEFRESNSSGGCKLSAILSIIYGG